MTHIPVVEMILDAQNFMGYQYLKLRASRYPSHTQ